MSDWTLYRDQPRGRIYETQDQRFRLMEAFNMEGARHWVLFDLEQPMGEQLVKGGIESPLAGAGLVSDLRKAPAAEAPDDDNASLSADETANEPVEQQVPHHPQAGAQDADDLFMNFS